MRCECCGCEITESYICPKCGFEHVGIIGENSNINEINAEEYREELVSYITDISVVLLEYSVIDNRYVETGRSLLKISDGIDAYKRIEWAGAKIGKNQPGDNIEKATLTVSYKYKGVEKKVDVSGFTRPAKSNNFWDIGVKIDDRLNLSLFLDNNCGGFNESSKTKLKIIG